MLRRLLRRTRALARLSRDNGFLKVLQFMRLRAAGSKAPIAMRFNDIDILIRPGTPDIHVAASCLGGEFNCLRHAYPAETTGLILDAGGYIGAAAVALARMYPQATILTVEPSAENFAILERNIAPYPNIRAIKAAIAPEGGGQIKLHDVGSGAWGFTVVEELGARGNLLESVPTVGISDLIDTYGGGYALIAKIDIEGAEVALFRTPGWLDKVGVMMIELHERLVPGCDELFWQTSARRFVFKPDNEKYVSVGSALFEKRGGCRVLGSAPPIQQGTTALSMSS
jgi:FkbM family methyltransferase